MLSVQFTYITEQKHQTEIKAILDNFKRQRPTMEEKVGQIKEALNKNFTLEQSKALADGYMNDFKYIEVMLHRASERFNEMFFESYREQDMILIMQDLMDEE